MAEFPALPFWTDAYMADCQHLSMEEHGIYVLLLIHMWRAADGKIPNDNSWLARRLKISDADVDAKVRPIIAEFCKTDGNFIWQKRLIDELNWVRKKGRKNSASAKARWNKEKLNANADANAMPETHSERISERNAPTPTPTPTLKKEELRSSKESLPEGFDLFWAAYPRHVAKAKAVSAYKAATKIAAPAEIIAGVRAFKFSTDQQYQPHPATWLNQRRWQDETAQPTLPRFVPGAI